MDGYYLTITHVRRRPGDPRGAARPKPELVSRSWSARGLFPCEYLPEVPQPPARFPTIFPTPIRA